MAESEFLLEKARSNPEFVTWLREQRKLLSGPGLVANILETRAHAIMVLLISKLPDMDDPEPFFQAMASYDEESAVSRPNRPLEESVRGVPIKKIPYEVKPLVRSSIPTLSLHIFDPKKWNGMTREDQAGIVAYCLTTALTILEGKYDMGDIRSSYRQMHLFWLKRVSL